MLLKRLDIQNFRVFYGPHTIDFASTPGKSVTVFHGENGAGKTTLLNAIHWCLTGEFTPRFKNDGSWLNKDAVKEGDSEGFVELWFEHNNKDYRVRRGISGGRAMFSLVEIVDGNTFPIESNAARFIEKIIPKELVKWFFFDAEAIGAFELSGDPQFKKDLRETLGFSLVDKLLRDLSACYTKKQKDLSASTSDKGLKALQENIDRLQHVLPGQLEKQENLEQQLSDIVHKIIENDKKLALQPQVSGLQKQRAQIESQQKNLNQDKQNSQKLVVQLLARSAAPLYIHDASIKLEQTLHTKEVQGKLPSPYSNQLVDDILASRKCICGREIGHESDEEHEIKGLLEFASTSELNMRLSDLRYLIRDNEKICDTFAEELVRLRGEVERIDQRIAAADADYDEITEKIKSTDQAEVKRLEAERDELRITKSKLDGEKAIIDRTIGENNKALQENKFKYDAASKKLDVSKKIQKDLNKLQKLIDFVGIQAKQKESQTLRVLTSELNQSLQKYLTKHFTAKINASNYRVDLIDDAGSTVQDSTGEGQLLKFAFISMLVAIAAKKTKEKIDFMIDPTIAPLVLDAPLSTLDQNYRSSVVKNLADNVDQLVLMGSSAAWSDSVEDALKPFIGKQYLVVSRARGPQDAKSFKSITVGSKTYRLNEYDSDRNDSYIQEI